jgi:signal-transduction protein with cAMP-binding, CBS, and nucleotidyltransferase domain
MEHMETLLMDIAEQLTGSPLFRGVDRADREALIKVMRSQSYPKGAVLFHKGDAGDSMYIILSGRVRIFTHDAQGNEITIRHLSEMFGEFSMLDQKPRSASASAAADLEVLVLHRDDFNAFLRERPLVGLSMMRTWWSGCATPRPIFSACWMRPSSFRGATTRPCRRCRIPARTRRFKD